MDTNLILFLVIILLFFSTVALLYYLLAKSKELKQTQFRFRDIINLDDEKKTLNSELSNLNNDISTIKEDYISKKTIFNKLQSEISLLEEDLELKSFGVYKPHFDFDTSEEYKEEIIYVRSQQKDLIKDKEAISCNTDWTVEGSKTKGRQMINRTMKLMLRAFNGECDSAILKAKWNNVGKMEERIRKSYEAINKFGEVQNIYVSQQYLNLKIDELRLAHEYEEKKYQEKEEQRRIREQIREEEKVQQEIERTIQGIEKEETLYNKALKKAKADLGKKQGAELELLNKTIAELERKIIEAEEKRERAKSRAQLTKSGHVYVISNIGSFGDEVYKIGMTRRLEPLDRVKELGDASVPFSFDVHAMIFSENAPQLEQTLHKEFNDQRVNLVNNRKEFFNINLEEIAEKAQQMSLEIEFTKLAAAKEYRESIAMKGKAELETEQIVEFPSEL